jgi:hypothetical protein
MSTSKNDLGGINGRMIYRKNPQQHPLARYNWITNKKFGSYFDPDQGPDPLEHNKDLCKICFTYKSISGSCSC